MPMSGRADASASLWQAVKGGAAAEDIGTMLKSIGKEQLEAKDWTGRTVLHHALAREAEVFEMILRAMNTKAISLCDECDGDVLHQALMEGNKEAVLLLAQRQRQEDGPWNPFTEENGWYSKLDALLCGPLAGDKEVVDLVAGLMPDSFFVPTKNNDPLLMALQSDFGDIGHAVDVCISRGPPMEKRLELWSENRMKYVEVAGQFTGLPMIRKMHEMLPFLPDDSGRRATTEAYAQMLLEVAKVAEDKLTVFKFVIEEGGVEVLEKCDRSLFRHLVTAGEAEWVVARAPCLLTGLFESEDESELMQSILTICLSDTRVREYLLSEIAKEADHAEIARLLSSSFGSAVFHRMLAYRKGWRWKLKPLFDVMPDAWEGHQWESLMLAIEHRQQPDVEYVLSVCSRAHLSMRNADGNTAYDLAEKDGRYPEELMSKLTVVTKNANG